MKVAIGILLALLAPSAASVPVFGEASCSVDDSEIPPEVQQKLDRWKAEAAKLASDPRIVKAVQSQNEKGPLSGMTNEEWKKVRRRDPRVTELQSNVAAKALAAFKKGSNEVVSEGFLNAAQGEKVAFLEKTSSYIHKGSSKFDVPFKTLEPWQGAREFDESSQTYQIQIAVPVVVKENPSDEKPTKPIGVLVIGIRMEKL